MGYATVGEALGVNPNSLKYAATTGTVVIRWEGARQPTVWTVPAPEIEPAEARRELARRYLHVFGPATATGFAKWAGVSARAAATAFESLADELLPAVTPIGEAWLLASDEAAMRAEPQPAARVRLLPSGDAYYLLWGDDRALLVPNAGHRSSLWTSRVWPGAVLIDGEIRGTWRRAQSDFTFEAWDRWSATEQAAVEAEAAALPVQSARI